MSVIEIVSLACLFILFLTMFLVVKNHFVLMRLGQQRVEQDGAMMNALDRTNSNSTANTPQQPRVGEMVPIGMHVISRQRGVQESEGNYIGTAIGIQRMIVEPSTFFPSKNCESPTSSRKR